VRPGTYPIETDVAESWTRTGDTTYVFKLRRGVRWHPKPPVNGRELTADDVKYTYERFLSIKGNGNRPTLEDVDRIEALDRYTVKFTLKEPFAWFLDALRLDLDVAGRAGSGREVRRLKRAEAVIGTGPWMLERYEPNVKLTFVRNPSYFVAGLPYADGVDVAVDADPSSRFASWVAGKYDFGPEYQQVVRRLDLDVARPRKPGLQTAEYIWFHRRLHRVQARPGAFQGRPGTSRPGPGQQLARISRSQPVLAGTRRPEPDGAGGGGRVVDSHRPADSRGARAVRAGRAGRQATARRGGLSRWLQGAGRDDGRVWPRLHGPRADRAEELEGGRDRDRSQAQGVRCLHREHDLRQVRQDDVRASRSLARRRQLPPAVPARSAASTPPA